jgi:hypothetical protein
MQGDWSEWPKCEQRETTQSAGKQSPGKLVRVPDNACVQGIAGDDVIIPDVSSSLIIIAAVTWVV